MMKKSMNIVKKMPHVFAIMSEAFFDIDKIPSVKFNEGYDPLKNFNRVIKESYSGKFVSNVFGGGTSNTEFSFLTGHSTSIADWTSDPYSIYIRKNTFALPRVLKNEGYETTAFHPGYIWFYNRFNVYDYFGFNKRSFLVDMPDSSSREPGKYVSDMDAFKFVLDGFKKHIAKSPNTPYFNFTVTIENHGPYSNTDIGNPKILKYNNKFDDTYYNTVNNYINGLMSCDKALGYLLEQFENTAEPIVLLYFPDHMPYIGIDFAGYKLMDYNIGNSDSLEAYLNTYECKYFIWSNKSAKELLTQNNKTIPVCTDSLISANFLSIELMNYIGMNDCEYFNYLNNVKNKIPVITSRYYKINNQFTETLSDSENKIISEYRKLQYYMMFDNQVK